MDPITAALNLIAEIVKNNGRLIDKMTPEQAERYAAMFLDDLKIWREFVQGIGLGRSADQVTTVSAPDRTGPIPPGMVHQR